MKNIFILSFSLLLVVTSFGKTWQVGPSRTYTKPSNVSSLVKDFDTVAIDSGLYQADVALWKANNLVLIGVNGMARLWANRTTYGGKAIWVIDGNNTTVENIEFAEAACIDSNGAGIRQEGINLTVRHCYFHDNQDGILAGDNKTSDILIEYCEFNHNGAGDGFSHNLYINHVQLLTFQFNYSHHARVGHELKTRALNNIIRYNRFSDEGTGTASRDIDLPNGGNALLLANVIEKGPNAQNSNLVEYGLEGMTNPDSQFYVVNNTFVNERVNGSQFIQIQPGVTLLRAYNNIFAGKGTILTGSAATTDTSHNFSGSILNVGFADATSYDYHLLSSSPCINNGISKSLLPTPVFEYLHPANKKNRVSKPKIDIGAFGFGTSGIAVDKNSKTDELVEVYPNPSTGKFVVNYNGNEHNYYLVIYSLQGKLILSQIIDNTQTATELDMSGMPDGLYIVNISGRTSFATGKTWIRH